MIKRFKVLGFATVLGTITTFSVAQETEPTVLETITLRGEKINRASQDAPTSISVIDGDEAENGSTDDLDDILNSQANVLADEGFQPPAIRGIEGTAGSALTAGSQPRIPILVDGVPLPSGDSTNIARTTVWDIDTVEVARGPQATSTGRNALGGAIRVFTKDPVFFKEGGIRLRYNSEGDAGIDFMLNTPLIEDQLALRIAGEFTDGQTFIDNFPNPLPNGVDPNDEDFGRLRAKLLFEPDAIPGLSVLLNAERNRSEGPSEGIFTGNIDDLTLNSPFGFSQFNLVEDLDHDVLSLQTTYEFNENFTGITRISRTDNDLTFLDSGELTSPGQIRFQKELTEAESYVQFKDLGIVTTGVLGIIRSDETEVGSNDGMLLGFTVDGEIENSAVYGEVELDASSILQGLAVILGGRIERSEVFRNVVSLTGAPIGSIDTEETVFLPKVGIRFDINDDSSIGYTYSEGFRSGGLDSDLLAPFFAAAFSANAFESETIRNHEIYGKSTVASGALDLGASAFFYTFENAQTIGASTFPISGLPAMGNVPEAQGYGVELYATYRPTDRLTFDASLGLLRTEITQTGLGQSALLGLSLPRAPETTASIGVTYEHGNGLSANASARYVSERQTALLQPVMDSYTVVDLGLVYETEVNGGSLQFDAYINNLFDERFETRNNVFITSAGTPRTYGASLTFKF
ncbi:MAG: TonB-dependent receptor [Pseudomonadota bacterium]